MTDDADFMKEVVDTFLGEAVEHLTEFERLLLDVEQSGQRQEHVVKLFRIAHSVKGSAALLGFKKIEGVMHAAETALGRVRDEDAPLDGQLVDALMGTCDATRLLVTCVQINGEEGELDVSPAVARLDIVEQSSREPVTPGEQDDRGEAQEPDVAGDASAEFGPQADDKIRVKTKVLDRMMNLVGELVLVRNQILQQVERSSARVDEHLAGMSQRLSHITSELQESVMATRMQPIETLWLRFPRLVRDVSRSAGKDVKLISRGSETELDKSIIEQLYDPLIHLIRNAVDHGIESEEERREAGKPRVGLIQLRAFHEGGLIHIEMSDDGGGVDLGRVRSKAVSSGLVSAGAAETLTRDQLLDMIFHPGFSTKKEVSALSGRGVGLDVVRANIEKLGGTVSVETWPTKGTSFRLSIPVTLAIIPALLVRSGDQRFAIPQASLLEVLHLSSERAKSDVTDIEGASTFRLRDELLPLVHLDEVLNLRSHRSEGALSVVVLESEGTRFGLAIDEILDTEEIVVKALWPPLRAAGCFAGATILGDGSVSLILDAEGLGARARVVRGVERSATKSLDETERGEGPFAEPVLVCQTGHGARVALRLSDVHRLEEIPVSTVETTGGGDMVQYRGRILPLVRLNQVLEERRAKPREEQNERTKEDALDVIVCSLEQKEYGLVVDSIVDIVDTELDLQWPGARKGVKGSMIVSGRVTEFLDMEFLAREVRGKARPLGETVDE